MLTQTGPEDKKPRRRIMDFSLHDGNGNLQPFEMSRSNGITITALVTPLDDGIERNKKKGIRCERFGPIKDWKISGYKEGTEVIWLSTELADYKCVKPARSYRSYFDHFSQKARVCVEVYRRLAKTVGGNPSLALEELVAGVVRSISSNGSFNGTLSKNFVISTGEFIHSQFTELDLTANNDDEALSTLPVIVALRNECQSISKLPAMLPNGSLTIRDEQCKEVTASEDEDAKLARLVQEAEEWKMAKKQRSKSGTSQKNVYIKISEAEIANDYPLPAYYKPYTTETDEHVIFDNEVGMSVNDLPVNILNNWALYNSDSRLVSLELVPMKPGAENDIVIFGSGSMTEDDRSFRSTAEAEQLSSSSSSKSGQKDDGIPIYLSPIKEWLVEFGSSVICITIRTSVAW
jgi:DNA (cytosine-5)-methyltransferase 1